MSGTSLAKKHIWNAEYITESFWRMSDMTESEEVRLFFSKKNHFLKQTEQKNRDVLLYVDGKLSTRKEVTKACKICEGYSYMADYVMDDGGFLREIHYDRINYK